MYLICYVKFLFVGHTHIYNRINMLIRIKKYLLRGLIVCIIGIRWIANKPMSSKHNRLIDLSFWIIYAMLLNSRKIDVLFFSESTSQICPELRHVKNLYTSRLLIKGKHDFEWIEHSADEASCDESSKERRKYYLSISSFGEIKLATLTNNRSEFIRDWWNRASVVPP